MSRKAAPLLFLAEVPPWQSLLPKSFFFNFQDGKVHPIPLGRLRWQRKQLHICLSMQSHLLQSQSSSQPCACSAARIPPCKGELKHFWGDFGSKMLSVRQQARDSTACHLEPEAGPCDQRLTRQTENQMLSTTLITGGTSARANVRGECSCPKLEL